MSWDNFASSVQEAHKNCFFCFSDFFSPMLLDLAQIESSLFLSSISGGSSIIIIKTLYTFTHGYITGLLEANLAIMDIPNLVYGVAGFKTTPAFAPRLLI
ncbi:hypothetical protein ACJX0J_038877 [Zea mays]